MWRLRGQEPALRQIDRTLKEGRFAHAYLLVGPPQVGKATLAIDMARAVNCLSAQERPCGECAQCLRIASGQHADVLTIGVRRRGEEGAARTEIGIGDVREVQHQAILKPYEGSSRVFIFDGAERMSEEAANALLKTLEEPPPQVMIILLTSQEEVLLPTIRSRCRRLELRSLPLSEVARELVRGHSAGEEQAERLARLSMGRMGRAISALNDPSIIEKRNEDLQRVGQLARAGLKERFDYASELASLFSRDRQGAREMLHLWLEWWRDILLVKEGAESFVHHVEGADALRERAPGYSTAQVVGFMKALLATLDALEHNANPRLALEVLMLGLPAERTSV